VYFFYGKNISFDVSLVIYINSTNIPPKILRKIFGPNNENGIWRIKTNQELDEIIKLKNIINFIRAQRLSWLGHI